MTKEREEQLINDVGQTKGLLERFVKEFDSLKPTLASCAEVEAVNTKLDKHIENHKWNIGTLVAAIAGIGGLIVSIVVAWSKGLK